MIENNPSNVSAAFEMLSEEVEAEIDFVNRIGSKSFEGRDYDRAREALTRAGTLTAFRDKLSSLRKEWDDLAAEAESHEDEATRAERRNLGRLRKGMRTPEAQFRTPLLEILAEMGGSGDTSEVIDRIGKRMKKVLKDVDYDPLASDSDMPRWRNTVQWACYALVRDGLLKANSPRGIWELSDKGRASLKQDE